VEPRIEKDWGKKLKRLGQKNLEADQQVRGDENIKRRLCMVEVGTIYWLSRAS
jgi:hypothetical protein